MFALIRASNDLQYTTIVRHFCKSRVLHDQHCNGIQRQKYTKSATMALGIAIQQSCEGMVELKEKTELKIINTGCIKVYRTV